MQCPAGWKMEFGEEVAGPWAGWEIRSSNTDPLYWDTVLRPLVLNLGCVKLPPVKI